MANESMTKILDCYFRGFEKAYLEKDKETLKGMLSKSQQTWCFEELDERSKEPSHRIIKVEIDPNSIRSTATNVTVSGMVCRGIDRGQYSDSDRFIFSFTKHDKSLVLTEMIAPRIVENNILMERAGDLGLRFMDAVNPNFQRKYAAQLTQLTVPQYIPSLKDWFFIKYVPM